MGPPALVHGEVSWQQYGASPIPSPEILDKYNTLIPNGAERFMSLVERQSEHRQELESFVVHQDASRSHLGLVFALVVTLCGFALVGFVAWINQPIVASIFGAAELASLVAVFIGERQTRQKRLDDKNHQ